MASFNHVRVFGGKNVFPCASRPASSPGGLALVGAALLLMLLGPACGAKSDPKKLASIPADASPREVHCLGRIQPGEKVLVLAAPPGSIVKDLLVHRHDRVKRGQTVVIFDRFAPTDAGVRQAEAELRMADVQLAQARGDEKLAEIAAQEAGVQRCKFEQEKAVADMNRAERLRTAGSMSQDDFETASLCLKRAGAALEETDKRLAAIKTSRPTDIAFAESRFASATAALERARAEADLCAIRAPIDGVVIDINAWPGEAVGQSGVLDLGCTDQMMVEAEVYINDVNHVAIGAPARVRGDGFTGEVNGRVTEVIGEVGPNALYPSNPYSFADQRVVKVRIRLDDGARLSALSNALVNVTIGP
jgi:HlyD family secretion protein